MEFKDRLKNLRLSKNVTQQELALKIFVSRSAVAKWENGLGIPSDINLKALCEFFEVEESWLLDRNDLKTEVNSFKLQKKNTILSVLGVIFPVLLILFSVSPLYDFYYAPGMIYPMVYIGSRSMMDFLSIAWQIIAYLIWGATVIFQVLNIGVVFLKKHYATCFWINMGLILLSLFWFIALFVSSNLIAKEQNFWLGFVIRIKYRIDGYY